MDAMYGPAAAEHYERMTGAHLDRVLAMVRRLPPGDALDVGCGTGALVRALRQAGWRARGIDRSRHMVSQARRRGPRAAFSQGDATRLPRLPSVDLVTATFDVFSHLQAAAQARAFLRGAARSLRPGGTLLFDAITPHDIDRNWVDYVHYVRRDRWRLVRFGRRVAPGVCELRYDWFVRERDGRWRHQHERHRLRAWTRAQVQSWLRSVGFGRIRCMDAATLRTPGRACVRWLFMASR